MDEAGEVAGQPVVVHSGIAWTALASGLRCASSPLTNAIARRTPSADMVSGLKLAIAEIAASMAACRFFRSSSLAADPAALGLAEEEVVVDAAGAEVSAAAELEFLESWWPWRRTLDLNEPCFCGETDGHRGLSII